MHACGVQGYICSNVDTEKGKRAIDLLHPWLEGWKRRNPNTVRACMKLRCPKSMIGDGTCHSKYGMCVYTQ